MSFQHHQFSSVAQSCPTLCDPLNRSTPGLPVHHHLPEFTQTQVPLCSVQFSSVTQLCPTLWDPMNHSTPGLPVHHQLPEFTPTHVHRVSDAIQPSHPWSFPSPPARNPSQHQSLFQCMKVKSESEVSQSCPILSDPMDCSLPGSSAHGILQARILAWVAIPFSRGFS